MMTDQTDSKKTPWMAGLFAGIFSSADGKWVPMEQLRRFSSVGAWIWAFGIIAYGIFWIVEKSKVLDRFDPTLMNLILGIGLMTILMMIVAGSSFAGFLWIGGQEFKGERNSKKG